MANLIAPTTDPAESVVKSIATDYEGVAAPFKIGATFRVTGGLLGKDEYVTLSYLDNLGNEILAEIGGNDGKILNENNSVCTIYGRMVNFKVSKSATSAPRGVEVV